MLLDSALLPAGSIALLSTGRVFRRTNGPNINTRQGVSNFKPAAAALRSIAEIAQNRVQITVCVNCIERAFLVRLVSMMKKILLLIMLLAPGGSSFAEDLAVAAAADLNFALQDLAARYQQKSGNKISLSFGASGNFYSLIQSGAPYDLFFSADSAYPQ